MILEKIYIYIVKIAGLKDFNFNKNCLYFIGNISSLDWAVARFRALDVYCGGKE